MKKLLLLALLFLVLINAYQNCSDMRLARPDKKSSPLLVDQPVPRGYLCSELGPRTTTPLKILFVVDMSASNYGGILSYKAADFGVDLYRYTTGKWYKAAALDGMNIGGFDLTRKGGTPDPVSFARSIVVSDGDGLRFSAIRKFAEPGSPCSALSAGVSYSVVGFSNAVMLPRTTGQTCDAPFVSDIAEFNRLADGMKSYQDLDLADPKTRPGGTSNRYNMGFTNYTKGLDCGAEKIETDALRSDGESPYYYTVFMSDGLPTDEYDPCPKADFHTGCSYVSSCIESKWKQCLQEFGFTSSQITDCYAPNGTPDYGCIREIVIPKKVQQLKSDIETVSSGFKFQPVFYWPQGQTGNDYDAALRVLGPLAQIGGVPNVLRIQNDTDMLDLAQKVCSTIETNMQTNYRIKNYMAVNLTARLVAGELKADSDADGIVDSDEVSGQVTNARNANGVLDRLCQLQPAQCNTPLTCDRSKYFGIGFNDCDIKLMQSLTAQVLKGIDDNKSEVLDFIELIKGGNPLAPVGLMNGDGDEISYLMEIAKGYDLRGNDALNVTDSANLMTSSFDYVNEPSMCGAGEETMKVTLDHVPLAKVEAFDDPRNGPLSLSHAKDENVVAVIYTVTPTGSLVDPIDKTYAQIVRIKAGPSGEIQIKPDNFIELTGGMD